MLLLLRILHTEIAIFAYFGGWLKGSRLLTALLNAGVTTSENEFLSTDQQARSKTA